MNEAEDSAVVKMWVKETKQKKSVISEGKYKWL